jgi:uncharacterized protein with HXXEE motif
MLSRKSRQVSTTAFRRLVWLFPIAYTLHVFEELPLFTSWARQYANASFTLRDYLTVHVTGVVVAVAAPLLISCFPNRVVIFLFFSFVFTPAVFFNIIFHAGATAVFGVYSPGLITAITVYPVIFFMVSRQALRENLISRGVAMISFLLAGLFHAADVSHNVFKAW